MRLTIFILLVFFFQLTYADSALVVIDMQPYFANRHNLDKDDTNREKINEVLKKQAELINEFKKLKLPIIIVEYDLVGWVKDPKHAETSSELKDAIGDYKNKVTIVKTTDGMFDPRNKSLTELKKYIEDKRIDQLVITGANGGACVNQSINGALKNNIKIIAVPVGIADFNYEKFMYPYKYTDNSFDTKSCSSCSFKQENNFAQIILMVNSKDMGAKKSELGIDNSTRTDKIKTEKPQSEGSKESTHDK